MSATTVTYTYDAAGNLKSLQNPDGTTTHYGYDADNREASVTDSNGHVSSFGYDNAGRRTTEDLPNGTHGVWAYDAASQVTSITWTGPASQTLSTIKYSYDPVGNKTEIDDNSGKNGFSYDALDRLGSASYGGRGVNVTYAYDPAGNRTSMTVSGITTTYTYDAANRLLSVNGSQVTSDGNGNVLVLGSQSFAYDSRNRLVEAVTGSVTEHFAYDGADQRARPRSTARRPATPTTSMASWPRSSPSRARPPVMSMASMVRSFGMSRATRARPTTSRTRWARRPCSPRRTAR